MQIRYAASDPSVTELEVGDSARAGKAMLGIGGGGALVALVMLVILLRSLAAQRRARARASGGCCRSPAKRVGKSKSKIFQVEWSDGSQTRRTAGLREDRLTPIGSEIVVFIDPRSGRGWWEGEY